MNIKNWFRAWAQRAAGFAKRNIGINTPGWLEVFAFGGGPGTASGVVVNEHNALNVSVVYECVRVISDTIASLPLFLYERTASGKDRAIDHPLYEVLHVSPNPQMTPFEFKQTMQGHLCLWGNAFAQIIRNGAGQIVEVWPLRPDRMRLQEFNDRLFYYYTFANGSEQQLREVLHLRGLSSDGLVGYSPITLQREKLGLAKASEEYRARFFSNDARPGGVLTHPGQLSDAAYNRLRRDWEEKQGGANRRRPAILEENMKWQDVGIPPDDMQFVEGEEFSKADIAAIFRVPSYKIGLLKPGTVSYASVEQQAIDFVVDCIRPWLVCWEERATLSFLTRAERRAFFCEFLVEELLRGDSTQRAAFYQALSNIGAITINEIRARENMNGIGPDGDRHYVPLNMVPVDLVDKMLLMKAQPAQNEPGEPKEPENAPKQLNGAAH